MAEQKFKRKSTGAVVSHYLTVSNDGQTAQAVIYQNEEGRLVWIPSEEWLVEFEALLPTCCVCGTTENLHDDGWYGMRCSSPDCVCF